MISNFAIIERAKIWHAALVSKRQTDNRIRQIVSRVFARKLKLSNSLGQLGK